MFSFAGFLDLPLVWYALIVTAVFLYVILDGFDLGVGILFPFAPSDQCRDRMMHSIAPFWDGNEVWLLTFGGALFAAFPHVYATVFSGFYLALVVILLALIVRGVAFEFRSKHDDPRWRKLWDWSIFFGSAVPALLWGVAFANLVRGVPIAAERFVDSAAAARERLAADPPSELPSAGLRGSATRPR